MSDTTGGERGGGGNENGEDANNPFAADAVSDAQMEEIMAQLMVQPGNFYDGGRPPAATKYVDELPDVVITKLHVELEESCRICLAPFEVGDDCKKLPCRHLFHDECCLELLHRGNACPLCRYELPTLDVEYEARKREEKRAAGAVPDREPSLMYM